MLIPKLTKIASANTRRSSFAEDAGTSVIGDLDNSFEFFSYLRALFYADRLKKDAKSRAAYDSKFKLSNQNIVFLPRDKVVSPGISL